MITIFKVEKIKINRKRRTYRKEIADRVKYGGKKRKLTVTHIVCKIYDKLLN